MTAVRTATVMFTDVVESTARSTRLGPARADEMRRDHFDVVRQVLGQHGGVEVKTLDIDQSRDVDFVADRALHEMPADLDPHAPRGALLTLS